MEQSESNAYCVQPKIGILKLIHFRGRQKVAFTKSVLKSDFFANAVDSESGTAF